MCPTLYFSMKLIRHRKVQNSVKIDHPKPFIMFIRSVRLTSAPRFVRLQSSTAYADAKALLKTDLKRSMLAKDTIKKDTVKGLMSAIKNKEIDTKPSQHNEFLLFELYSKSISQRRDSKAEYEKLGRPELAEKEQKEIEIIQTYLNALPVASQSEIEAKVNELLDTLIKETPDLKIGQIFSKVNWQQVNDEWKASDASVRGTIAKLFKERSK